jgi:hypothetical protein
MHHVILTENGLGYILGDFSQTHLVTLNGMNREFAMNTFLHINETE